MFIILNILNVNETNARKNKITAIQCVKYKIIVVCR